MKSKSSIHWHLARKEVFDSTPVLGSARYHHGKNDFIWLVLFFVAITLTGLFFSSAFSGLNLKISETVVGALESEGASILIKPARRQNYITRDRFELLAGNSFTSTKECKKKLGANEKRICDYQVTAYPVEESAPNDKNFSSWWIDDRFWCEQGYDSKQERCFSASGSTAGRGNKDNSYKPRGLRVSTQDPLWKAMFDQVGMDSEEEQSKFPLSIVINKQVFSQYFNVKEYLQALDDDQNHRGIQSQYEFAVPDRNRALYEEHQKQSDKLDIYSHRFLWVKYLPKDYHSDREWRYPLLGNSNYQPSMYIPLQVTWMDSFPTYSDYLFLFPFETDLLMLVNAQLESTKLPASQIFLPYLEGDSKEVVSDVSFSSDGSFDNEKLSLFEACLGRDINSKSVVDDGWSVEIDFIKGNANNQPLVDSVDKLERCLLESGSVDDINTLKSMAGGLVVNTIKTNQYGIDDHYKLSLFCDQNSRYSNKWGFPNFHSVQDCESSDVLEIDIFSEGVTNLHAYTKDLSRLHETKEAIESLAGGDENPATYFLIERSYSKGLSRAGFLNKVLQWVSTPLVLFLAFVIFAVYLFMVLTVIEHRKTNYGLMRVSGFKTANVKKLIQLQIGICYFFGAIFAFMVFVLGSWLLDFSYGLSEAYELAKTELGGLNPELMSPLTLNHLLIIPFGWLLLVYPVNTIAMFISEIRRRTDIISLVK